MSSSYSIGRAVIAPPDLPEARVATLADPDFQAAAKAKLEIDALPGAELQALISGGGSLPPPLIERARRIIGVEKAAK